MDKEPILPPLPEPAEFQQSPVGQWRLDRTCPVVGTWTDYEDNAAVYDYAARDTPDNWIEEKAMPVLVMVAHVATVAGYVKDDSGTEHMVWKTVLLDDQGCTWATTSLAAWYALGDIVRIGADFTWKVGTIIRAEWTKKGRKPAQITLKKVGD